MALVHTAGMQAPAKAVRTNDEGITRRARPRFAVVAMLLLATACAGGRRRDRPPRGDRPGPPTRPTDLVSRITPLKEGGGRLDWVGDKIAFDMQGPSGAFTVYVMRPDGSDTRCLTCDHPELPRRHVGQPAWHPSGRYLVVQALKADHARVRFTHALTPGGGVLNDLWVLDTQTGRASLVREVPNNPGKGTLHPHFSPDGRMLAWSEMEEGGSLFEKGKHLGYWQLMLGEFRVEGGRPRLANVRAVTPGGPGIYENHGFSPDGSRLIFSSNFEARRRLENHVYVLELQGGKLTRMTATDWNEHAHYAPDGRAIVWMSTTGIRGGGADYWIMDPDGARKRRLTYFNEKGHPHYVGPRTMVADFAWRPDGRAFAGYTGGQVIRVSATDPSRIVLVELSPAALR